MGRDKALIEIDGRPLALIAADALRAAGADRVVVVGGDADALAGHGLEVHPDDQPGEGPLGAIVTALELVAVPQGAVPSDDHIVMVLACDMPAIDRSTVAAVVGALRDRPDAEAAAPRIGDRLQILTAAYRIRLRAHLAAAFEAGERAPRRALDGVEVVAVEGLDPARLADVDRPDDLHRYARPHVRPSIAVAPPPERGSV